VTKGDGYAHRACIAQWLAVQKLSYCSKSGKDPPSLCPVCLWEQEAAKWRADFSIAVEMLLRAFDGEHPSLDSVSALELFSRIADASEVSALSDGDLQAAAPIGIGDAAVLLQRATEEMHPQEAIRSIMRELCADVLGTPVGFR